VNKNTAKFWRVTIDDQGPGIREESGEAFPGARYFERFYSERPQGEKENHSGLGLSIVRTIAEGYGGRCSLANRYDRGKSAAGESPAERRVEGCRFVMILPAAG
jgi:signal transduction histidine kinase